MQEQAHSQGGSNPLTEVFQDVNVSPKRLTFDAGSTVFEPSDPAGSLYYIHRGQIRLFQISPDNDQRLLEILGPDDWFGSAALAKTPTQEVRAVAVSSSIVTEVKAQKLLEVMSHKPQALMELNRQLAARLHAARDEAACLIFQDCNDRLVQTLLRFANTSAATHGDQGVVLRITHQQLAQAVGVARETVSLALTQLRQKQLLQTGRNQLTFNPEALRQFKSRMNMKHAESNA